MNRNIPSTKSPFGYVPVVQDFQDSTDQDFIIQDFIPTEVSHDSNVFLFEDSTVAGQSNAWPALPHVHVHSAPDVPAPHEFNRQVPLDFFMQAHQIVAASGLPNHAKVRMPVPSGLKLNV